MEHTLPPRGADFTSPARRYPGAVLLLAIVSLLIACGGSPDSSSWTAANATSPNSGTLTWDAVTAPGLSGYRVYFGTAPGTYGQGQPVGNGTTTYQLTGLSSQTTYYFAVTAVDSNTNESPYSNEVFKAIP